MNTEQLKKALIELPDILEFEYKGQYGNIDHFWNLETETEHYLLYFDGEETTVHSAEDAMTTPFVDGHSLAEIAELLDIE